MNDAKIWWVGFALIAVFVFIGELAVAFGGYIFNRPWLNRNLILSALWLLPALASFLVVYFSKKMRVFKGLSLIFVLSVFGPLVHLFFGQLGAVVDLAGFSGLRVTFQIYFVFGSLIIGVGVVAGMLFKRSNQLGHE